MHVPWRKDRIEIYIHAGGDERVRLTSPELPPNSWTHVAVVADHKAEKAQLMINGKSIDAASLKPLATPLKLREQVVGREGEDRRYLAGAIDDVRVYSSALTEKSVRALCPQVKPLPQDMRNIATGRTIPDEGYCDQPYVVVLDDGTWLCTLTTGHGHEGGQGQHVVSTRSTDHGRTWSPLVNIEPSDGPAASWVVPLKVPSGRVYGFYTYNGDRINSLPGRDRKIRNDMLGWYCFRYTDDGGKTWSDQRYRVPMRLTACDRGNQWNGDVIIFWGIDKPKLHDGGAMFAVTKLGRYMLKQGEGWLLWSDNILTQRDPDQIHWELRPTGEHGVRNDTFGSVQEEFNHVSIGPRQQYMVYRTKKGYPCHTYSDDLGQSWREPEPMTYEPGGRTMKNPRACPKLWRCENGKYLFWFHNHGGRSFKGRNPAWLSSGEVRDGKMHWSEPEIVLYADNPNTRISYPDLIEQDGKYWITETQKSIARVHRVDPSLLKGMWNQGEVKEVTREGLVVNTDGEKAALPENLNLSRTGGLTVDCRLQLDNPKTETVLVDGRDENGRGILLQTTKEGTVKIAVSDGATTASWNGDRGLLEPGKRHHVVAIVDDGPRIISFVVDGRFCDGGTQRRRGWGRYKESLA